MISTAPRQAEAPGHRGRVEVKARQLLQRGRAPQIARSGGAVARGACAGYRRTALSSPKAA
jgi:hypothetical protein